MPRPATAPAPPRLRRQLAPNSSAASAVQNASSSAATPSAGSARGAPWFTVSVASACTTMPGSEPVHRHRQHVAQLDAPWRRRRRSCRRAARAARDPRARRRRRRSVNERARSRSRWARRCSSGSSAARVDDAGAGVRPPASRSCATRASGRRARLAIDDGELGAAREARQRPADDQRAVGAARVLEEGGQQHREVARACASAASSTASSSGVRRRAEIDVEKHAAAGWRGSAARCSLA